MSTVVDLGTMATQGFAVAGDDPGDYAGWSVSGAGDVNGDGFADIIIGAPANSDGGGYAGKAYVIYGGPEGIFDIDLNALEPTDGFVVVGNNSDDLAGFSVSAAGDVNGDGFDDIIVGANVRGFYYSTSHAYVIFGTDESRGTIDLSILDESDGATLVGSYNDYTNGFVSVSAAGDVNGDGFDDVIIGSPYDYFGAGGAYVVFGKGDFTGLDLPGISEPDGFVITGEPGSYDFAGLSVSAAGDFNGDGYDDLIVGAPYGDNGGDYAGEAYVIFGKMGGFGPVDLSNLAEGEGFVIQGDDEYNKAGYSVSGAGDINGDGFDDIIVGAPYASSGGTHSGTAYVIFGTGEDISAIDLSNLASDAGFIIQGDDTGDHLGWSVSAAGDVNNDGYDDIIVGAPDNDNTRGGAPRTIDAGETYIIFGKAGGFGTIDVTNLAETDGFLLQGEEAYDRAGLSVSGAGDVDGDGFHDLLIGAPYSDAAGEQSGAFYLVSGRFDFGRHARDDFDGDGRSDILWRHEGGLLTDWLGTMTGGFQQNFANSAANVATSWQVVGTGDFNGDGQADILWRHDSGLISDWLGEEDGGFADNFANAAANVATSWQVVGTGDFDNDGHDDILWRHDSGLITNWLGEDDGGFGDNFANAAANVATSWHVAGTGDFNGDGHDDILWRHDSGLITNWLGEDDGGFADNFANAAANVATSWQIVGTGDFNGDGEDDILWRHDSGLITNWLGEEDGGFTANNAHALSQVSLEWSVADIGDYNGDGHDDILWRHDSGLITNWLGTGNGGFAVNNGNALNSVPTDWNIQAPEIFG